MKWKYFTNIAPLATACPQHTLHWDRQGMTLFFCILSTFIISYISSINQFTCINRAGLIGHSPRRLRYRYWSPPATENNNTRRNQPHERNRIVSRHTKHSLLSTTHASMQSRRKAWLGLCLGFHCDLRLFEFVILFVYIFLSKGFSSVPTWFAV